MATDPLSSATRAAKRNLLLASTVAITYSAFNISISKIPVGGLAIEFDDRVFAFLLIMVTLYFLTTFILYYCIDIRNIEKTKHQTEKETRHQSSRASFWSSHASRVIKRIEKMLPKGIGYNPNSSHHQLGKFFQEMEQPFFDLDRSGDHIATTMVISMMLHVKPTKAGEPPRPISWDENPALHEMVKHHFFRALSQYRRGKQLHTLLLTPSLYGVRALYFVRNYIVDGIFPVALAVLAVAGVFQIVDLHFLRVLVPIPRATP